MKLSLPLISCICVTRNRPIYLSKAIAYFQRQSYSQKELIVVYEDDDFQTEKVLKEIEDKSIKSLIIKRKDNIPLGELRNLGIAYAQGFYICQWDDDDWYHADRLKLQYEHIKNSGYKGSILDRWIVYDKLNKRAYLSHSRLWEGSVMCEKETMVAHPYPKLKIDEDTVLIYELFDKNFLSVMKGCERLYVYIVHGKNTWDRQHFSNMLSLCEAYSAMESLRVKQILEGDDFVNAMG